MAGHAAPYEVPADGADDDLDGTWSAGAGAAPAGVPPPHNILLIEDATDSARLSPPLLTPLPLHRQELQNTILDKVHTSIDATNRSPDTPASPATGDAEQSKLADAIICNHVDVVRGRTQDGPKRSTASHRSTSLHTLGWARWQTCCSSMARRYEVHLFYIPGAFFWCFSLPIFRCERHLPLIGCSNPIVRLPRLPLHPDFRFMYGERTTGQPH